MNRIEELQKRQYLELEQQNSRFAAAAAKIRAITENERYQIFAFATLSARERNFDPEYIDWVITRFAEQVARERTEKQVPKEIGWSPKGARRIALPPGQSEKDFYFPTSTKTVARWLQHLTEGFSISGFAEHIDRITYNSADISFSKSKQVKVVLSEFRKYSRELLDRGGVGPIPDEAESFLMHLCDTGLNNFPIGRTREICFCSARNPSGNHIELIAETGVYWTNPEIGSLSISILPSSATKTE